VPDHEVARLVEHGLADWRLPLDCAGLDPCDDLVVELHHRQVKLRDDQVLVIPRVADGGEPAGRTWQIVPERRFLPHRRIADALAGYRDADLEQVRIFRRTPIQVRLDTRPRPVQAIEVQRRRSEVVERERIDQPLLERGRIKGDVVVHELAEVREAGRDTVVVAVGVLGLFEHRFAQGHERIVGRLERRQIEHPPELARLGRSAARNVVTLPRHLAVNERSRVVRHHCPPATWSYSRVHLLGEPGRQRCGPVSVMSEYASID
jgi:hypothetical protein